MSDQNQMDIDKSPLYKDYEEIPNNEDDRMNKHKYHELLTERDKLFSKCEQLAQELADENNKNNETVSENEKLIKACNQLAQDLNAKKNENHEILSEYKKLKKENNELVQSMAKLRNDQERNESNHKKVIFQLNNKIESLQEKKKMLSDGVDQLRCDQDKNERDFESKIMELNNKIEFLQKKNKTLNDENSGWQNYIGKATTFTLKDNDVNHSTQFTKDIESLQTMIVDYVGILRKVNINYEEVNKLLRLYKCHTRVKSNENELSLVKAVLQRHVFEEVIKSANNYLSLLESNIDKQTDDRPLLESNIYKQTDNLLELLRVFSIERDGTNDITTAGPIKVRQQMYGLLGSLGFANIIKEGNKEEHYVICNIKNKLNETINKLRTIKDLKKSKKHDDMATNIVRELIRICYFRLKVQEPIVKYEWFSYNDVINPNLMDGRWEDEDTDDANENNDLLVEFCSFPLFVSNYTKKDQKIYSRAKIVCQVKQQEQIKQVNQQEQVRQVKQQEQIKQVNQQDQVKQVNQQEQVKQAESNGNIFWNTVKKMIYKDKNQIGNQDDNQDDENPNSNQGGNPGDRQGSYGNQGSGKPQSPMYGGNSQGLYHENRDNNRGPYVNQDGGNPGGNQKPYVNQGRENSSGSNQGSYGGDNRQATYGSDSKGLYYENPGDNRGPYVNQDGRNPGGNQNPYVNQGRENPNGGNQGSYGNQDSGNPSDNCQAYGKNSQGPTYGNNSKGLYYENPGNYRGPYVNQDGGNPGGNQNPYVNRGRENPSGGNQGSYGNQGGDNRQAMYGSNSKGLYYENPGDNRGPYVNQDGGNPGGNQKSYVNQGRENSSDGNQGSYGNQGGDNRQATYGSNSKGLYYENPGDNRGPYVNQDGGNPQKPYVNQGRENSSGGNQGSYGGDNRQATYGSDSKGLYYENPGDNRGPYVNQDGGNPGGNQNPYVNQGRENPSGGKQGSYGNQGSGNPSNNRQVYGKNSQGPTHGKIQDSEYPGDNN